MGLGASEAFEASPRFEVTLRSWCWAGSAGWMTYQEPLCALGEAPWQPHPSLAPVCGQQDDKGGTESPALSRRCCPGVSFPFSPIHACLVTSCALVTLLA